MSTQIKTVKLNVIGADAGPFNITDDLGNVLATNVTRQQLLDGIEVSIDDAAKNITVTSVGSKCTNSISVAYNSGSGGGGSVTTFTIIASTNMTNIKDGLGEVITVTSVPGIATIVINEAIKRYPLNTILTGYTLIAMYDNTLGKGVGAIYEINPSNGIVVQDTGEVMP